MRFIGTWNKFEVIVGNFFSLFQSILILLNFSIQGLDFAATAPAYFAAGGFQRDFAAGSALSTGAGFAVIEL